MEALVLKRSAHVSRPVQFMIRRKLTITGHAGLAGNTSGDEDNLGTLKGGGEASSIGLVTGHGGVGVDVRDIGSNTLTSN